MLEGRTLLSTFTVTQHRRRHAPADNPTPGTLRWAVQPADANNQAKTIVFSSLFNTPQTINLEGGTLQLTDTAKTTLTGPGASLLTVNGGDDPGGAVFEVTQGAVAAAFRGSRSTAVSSRTTGVVVCSTTTAN